MLSAAAADIAGDLAPARRVTDVDRVSEIELLNEFREIVSISAIPSFQR
jgi:hypothetical protein